MDEANLYWQANTEKGRALTDCLSMLEDCADDAVRAQQEKSMEFWNGAALKLDLSGVGAGKTKQLFDRRNGQAFRKAASAAARVRSYVRRASATTCRSSTPAKPSGAFAAGTAVCTPILRKCRQGSPDPRR